MSIGRDDNLARNGDRHQVFEALADDDPLHRLGRLPAGLWILSEDLIAHLDLVDPDLLAAGQ
jgi:hypothetical protein